MKVIVQVPWIGLHDKRDHVPVTLTNVLRVPGIITNLITVLKLDLRWIYWRSDDQTLRIAKTNREVGVSRIVGDLHAFMADLHKVQQQATHLRDVIRNEGHYFTPSSVDISCDQATRKEESVGKITNLSSHENRKPLKDDSSRQSSDFPEHPPVKEGQPRHGYLLDIKDWPFFLPGKFKYVRKGKERP